MNTTQLHQFHTFKSFLCSFLTQSSVLLNLRNYPQHHAEKVLHQTGVISIYIVTLHMLFGIMENSMGKIHLDMFLEVPNFKRHLWAFLK